MDKRQFVEQVIDRVRELSVSSIVDRYVSLKRSGVNHLGICPFHNDTKIGSFVVTDSKKIWKCFSCGVGGDIPKFVSLFENINYLEAAFRIALETRQITQSDYDEYYANRRYKKSEIEKIQRRYEEIDKEKLKSHIADAKTLDKVFRLFISCCELSPEHEAHLKQVRGLSEEDLVRGMYFTFPTRRIMGKFLEKVREAFGNDDVLLTIPGFYKEPPIKGSLKKEYTFSKHKGIGIGIQNAKGQVVGIQIRHDNKGDKSTRYVWFSSSFAMYDEKYEGGTSSGSPIDVVYPAVIKNTSVVITEGRFKAEIIAKETGSIAISVQGVTTWRGILKELEAIEKSQQVAERYGKDVYRIHCLLVAFDADLNYKYQVEDQLKKMTDQLESHGRFIYYLNWDDRFGKGIDDLFLGGHRNEVKRYDKEVWDELYQKMLELILENEPYDKLSKVPEEIVRKYFEEHVRAKIYPLEKNKPGKKHETHIIKNKERVCDVPQNNGSRKQIRDYGAIR